jgi:hypothetical protein
MIRLGGAAIFSLEVAGEMVSNNSGPVDGASRRGALRLWMVAAVTVLVLAMIPGSTPAQEDETPTPMATPEIMILPSVAIFPYPAYGSAPLVVGFIPQVHDPAESEIIFYKWNFGDGHVATTPPLVTYNTYVNPGLYIASLTIVTADGRSATGFANVNVQPPSGG